MVRALDLKSGGPAFKSSCLPQGGFVFGVPHSTHLRFVKSQLVSFLPVGIFNKFPFHLQYLFIYLQCHCPQLARQC